MKPQLRPAHGLTRSILVTSNYWAFIHLEEDEDKEGSVLSVVPTSRIEIDGGLWMRHGCLWVELDQATCYPCEFHQETGINTPIPWPVLEGEIDIDERSPCDGFRPSPRRRINADGTVTPVWVWEADQ